jgi:hypothetical protein
MVKYHQKKTVLTQHKFQAPLCLDKEESRGGLGKVHCGGLVAGAHKVTWF